MKKVLLVLLAVVVLANFAVAQDRVAMTKAGDKAWLFQFNGLSTLGAGSYKSQGGTISAGGVTVALPTVNGVGIKYYLSNNFAGTAALLFGISSSTEKDIVAGNADETTSFTGFGAEVGIQSNVTSSGPFLAYFGAAANIILNSGTIETQNGADPTKTDEVVGSLTTFGVAGLAGFEYFIYDRISLGAEYRLGVSGTSGTVESTPAGGTTTKADLPSSTTVGFSTISFTLAAFW